jgi:hypothetical protein
MANTAQERANSYAFQLPLYMCRIVERVQAAIPDTIIDFDITEGGRAVGLSFLSAGKYFLINNGPYKFDYDLPMDRDKENWNLFFWPGAARTWICRTPLSFDKWLPSVLFLTHYFPDDPKASQMVNLGSLILGQNGIWGDLPGVSAEGVALIEETLAHYKQVRRGRHARDSREDRGDGQRRGGAVRHVAGGVHLRHERPRGEAVLDHWRAGDESGSRFRCPRPRPSEGAPRQTGNEHRTVRSVVRNAGCETAMKPCADRSPPTAGSGPGTG